MLGTRHTMNSFPDIWRLGFDPEELRKREEQNTSFHFPKCGLSFIDDHFGPRPGCIHGLLGSTGRGKSTLLQSLITEWGMRAKILLYLTEESFERLEAKLALKDEDVSYLTPKLMLIHEQQVLEKIPANSYALFLTHLRDKLVESEAKMLLVDNITTSHFYEGKLQSTLPILAGLRKIAQELEIPIFLIAHTRKGVSESKGLISTDDVRGSASLSNTCDYFYIFYRIRRTDSYGQPLDSSFVHVAKSRDHDNQDNLYKLEYDKTRKRYFRDKLTNFQTFKSFMKERDRA